MIRAIRFLFEFYIDASIHVALSVYALLSLFLLKYNLPYHETLMYTVFYGTITGYNLVKYAPVAKLHHKSLTKNLKAIQLFSIICFLALAYYVNMLPFRTKLLFFVGSLIVFAYALPVLKNRNLRSIGGIKIYLVAFCWSLAVAATPIIHFNLEITYQMVFEFIQVFVFVVALIIPFDIRDLVYDNKKLKTIPQQMGVENAKVIAYLLLILYLCINYVLFPKLHYSTVTFLTVVMSYLLIYKMPNKPVKYYCSFGIESLPILKLILVLLIVR